MSRLKSPIDDEVFAVAQRDIPRRAAEIDGLQAFYFLPVFRRRGRSAARSEWRLITATHNLLKLHKHQIAASAA